MCQKHNKMYFSIVLYRQLNGLILSLSLVHISLIKKKHENKKIVFAEGFISNRKIKFWISGLPLIVLTQFGNITAMLCAKLQDKYM